MKTNLQAKLIQHFASKKGNKGFTLIELLVVVIIIGILAAIALPSMLSQANKAKQAGAQSQVGAINRAQQSYRLENPIFGATLTDLGLGANDTDMDTADYTLAIVENSDILADVVATPIDTGSGLLFYNGCVEQDAGNTTAEIVDGDDAAADGC